MSEFDLTNIQALMIGSIIAMIIAGIIYNKQLQITKNLHTIHDNEYSNAFFNILEPLDDIYNMCNEYDAERFNDEDREHLIKLNKEFQKKIKRNRVYLTPKLFKFLKFSTYEIEDYVMDLELIQDVTLKENLKEKGYTNKKLLGAISSLSFDLQEKIRTVAKKHDKDFDSYWGKI